MKLFHSDAPSDPGWHDVNWQHVQRTVRRFQTRIVQATKEGRSGKVRRLQLLLTHSLAAKLLAVRQVTENRGKNTPGVDGEVWSTPKAKMKAVKSLTKQGYKPSSLRRVYIPKDHNRKRPLSIPTMKDRAMQALYLLALDPISETKADPSSYGFRKGRSTHDAIEKCFNALGGPNNATWVLKADIQGCYDDLSHGWLLEYTPMDKVMLRKWLKASFLEQGLRYATESGVPQGGIISPTIANMALDGLEALLKQRFHRTRRGNPKVNLSRYADDIVVTGASKELLEHEVKPLIASFLVERGLSLSAEKTVITSIEEGFDFLGMNHRKYGGKLLIKPSKKAIKRFKSTFSKRLAQVRTASQANVIRSLRPLVLGWTWYYRHVVSKQTFQTLDHWMFWKLWRWAKRRHPSKPKRWIRKRYFHTVRGDNWVFQVVTDDGIERLPKMAKVPIRRHTLIKGKVNPYDPDDELYFERRDAEKFKRQNAKKVQSLFEQQRGVCPTCGERIDDSRSWDIHHIIEKHRGGRDTLDNLVLLHSNCHRQVHAAKRSVDCPVRGLTVRVA